MGGVDVLCLTLVCQQQVIALEIEICFALSYLDYHKKHFQRFYWL